MRFALLVVLAFFLGCAPPAVQPTKRDLVRELRSDSVALVRHVFTIELTPDAIKIEPVDKPFCSGVWVSGTSLVTAHHCVDEMAIGEELGYVVYSELDEQSKVQHVRVAKLVAIDPDHDLAILRALVPPAHEVAALSIETIEPGDETHTMGHPFGAWFSYSSGDVAAVRMLELPAGDDDPIKKTLWIQTTAPISPGNSGGGLFDVHGHLIGICSRSRRDGQNLNFYIHRDHIRAFLAKQAVL